MASRSVILFVTLILTNYVVTSDKSNLVMVIDDTASMQNDIDQVKLGVAAIIDTVHNSNTSQIQSFILITFNDKDHGAIIDPGVQFRIETADSYQFRTALSAINVYGGGMCPEYALAGITKALEMSLDRSFIYVFTDATAKDYKDAEEVKALAQKKQTQIVFVLTNKLCNDHSSSEYQVYYDLAEATGGIVFELPKPEIGKVLEYVQKTVTARRTTLYSKKLRPGRHALPIKVDAIMGEVTLSLASAESSDPTVAVTAPDGSKVWTRMMVETDRIKVYSIDVTTPGVHVVDVGCKSETQTVVSAKSGIDFKHGFSAYTLPSIVDTSTMPAPGKSHLSIKLNEGDIELHTAQLLDMDDRVLLDLPLRVVNKGDKFYSTPAFDPPTTMFKVAIIGFDPSSRSNVTRAADTPVAPQRHTKKSGVTNKAPVVNVGSGVVNAEFDEPLQVVCKVHGYPQPSVVWKSKEKGTVIPGDVAIKELPYDYISTLSIEKVQENATYECIATNSIGRDSKTVNIKTISRNKFNIISTPEDIPINYLEDGRIECKIDAYPPATITWYKINEVGHRWLVHSDGHVVISADGSVVTIKQASLEDEGTYLCEARNTVERKLIHKYVAITGTESPEIDKTTAEKIGAEKGSTVTIYCNIMKGTPRPTIGWYYRRDSSIEMNEVEKWKDLESVSVPINSNLDGGMFRCLAENDVGLDYRDFTVYYKFPPVLEEKDENIRVKTGSRIALPCHAYGGPPPEVAWYKDGVEMVSSTKFPGDQTLRFVAKSSARGVYVCTATNEVASVSRTVNLSVYDPPTIKVPDSTILYKSEDEKVELLCEAQGDPKPTIEWMHRRFDTTTTSFRSTNEVVTFDRLQFSDDGYYTCSATNDAGTTNIAYELHVGGPAVITKPPTTELEAVEGDRALRIPCEVSGNPKPSVTWYKDGLNLALGSEFFADEGGLFVANVPKTASGSYTCRAENSLATDELTYQVTVLDYPQPTTPMKTVSILIGNEAEIECPESNKPLDLVRWFKNGDFIGRGILNLSNVTASDSGNYTCRVSNFVTSSTGTVQITVVAKLRFVYDFKEEDVEIKEGVVLNCECTGDPEPHVEWYLDGKILPETDPVYPLWEKEHKYGQYKCVARNVYGEISKTINVIQKDCLIDVTTLPTNYALMLTSRLEWPKYQPSGNYLVVPKNDLVNFVCTGKLKMFHKPYAIAFCHGGKDFLVNGVSHNYLDFECEEEIKHSVRETGIPCMPGNTELMKIVLNFLDRELVVYEVCMDKTTNTPIYSKVNMGVSSIAKEVTSWSDSEKFDIDFDEAYDCEKQIPTISRAMGEWFHYEDKCCFSRKQLVSPMDVFPGAPVTSTFSYFNAVPHWSSCNSENWEDIEGRIRYFRLINDRLIVFTGAGQELSLNSSRGMTVNRFFGDQRGHLQPVPKFLWKIILHKDASSSLAIVQVNVPDLDPSEVEDKYVFCKDRCNDYYWLQSTEWHDVTKGYTYCCSVEEFEKIFGVEHLVPAEMKGLIPTESGDYDDTLPEKSLT